MSDHCLVTTYTAVAREIARRIREGDRDEKMIETAARALELIADLYDRRIALEAERNAKRKERDR